MHLNSINFELSTENLDFSNRTQITQPELYDSRSLPIPNGLADPTLGATSTSICETCNRGEGVCLGHEGVIILAAPVLQPGLRNLFKKFMKNFCYECKKLVPDSSSTKRYCPNCEKYVKYNFITPYIIEDLNSKQSVCLKTIHQCLENMPLEERLAISPLVDPLHFFMKTLVVPGANLRYSTRINNKTIIDDLTIKLQTIISLNEKLKTFIKNEYEHINTRELYNLLSYEIFTYIDNKIPGIPVSCTKNGRVLKSLLDRLGTKEGLLRSNLKGKRTTYSGRFVITADPTLEVNEVGVPQKIAQKLITEVPVTQTNISEIRSWFEKDSPVKALCYNYKSAEGSFIKFRVVPELHESILKTLKVGDLVQRDLRTGDMLAINRPPTIHKYNLMAHRVVVYKDTPAEGQTLKLEPGACPFYNADFDGDEMHLFASKSYKTQFDLKMLMDFNKNIIDSKNNTPLLNIDKENLTSANHLSLVKSSFNRSEAIALLGPYFDNSVKKDSYTGFDLISMCLPSTFNFEEDSFIIRNGQMISGVLTKKNFSKNSTFTRQLLTYTNTEYPTYLKKMIYLFRNYYPYVGHTVCLQDYQTPVQIKEQSEKLLKEIESKVTPETSGAVIDQLMRGFQAKIYSKINSLFLNKVKNDSQINNILQMAYINSSGTFANLTQIFGAIGQRLVNGKVPSDFFRNDYPNIQKNTFREILNRRGWITNSYREGLIPREFINDCSTGREATLISHLRITAMGYFSRKIISGVSDLIISKDYNVIDSQNKIIQSKFGGTGTNLTTYNPLTEDPLLRKRITEEAFKQKEDDSARIAYKDLESAVCRLGFDSTKFKIIQKNSEESKVFTQNELIAACNSLYLPAGSPLGLALGHAITEPAVQLTLSSKHKLDSDENSFDKLENLILCAKTNPTLTFKFKQPSQLESVKKEILPLCVKDCFKSTIDANSGVMTLALEKKEIALDEIKAKLITRKIADYIDKLITIEESFKGKIQFKKTEEQGLLELSLTNLEHLNTLSKIYECIANFNVSGYSYIRSYHVSEDNLALTISGQKKLTVYKNLPTIVQKLCPNVEVKYKNPIYLYNERGVLHARKLLYQELCGFEKVGLKIDKRYFSLFSNLISATGKIIGMNRSGVINTKEPLVKCAFEATKSVIYKLALTKERDFLRSPCASMMVGQVIPIGPQYYETFF